MASDHHDAASSRPTMEEGVLGEVDQEGRRQDRAGRHHRRGRDRQGEHGVSARGRGRAVEAARQGGRHGQARRSGRGARRGRRGSGGGDEGDQRGGEARGGGEAGCASGRGDGASGECGPRAGADQGSGSGACGEDSAAAVGQAGRCCPAAVACDDVVVDEWRQWAAGRVLASPFARKLALEKGVDLRSVTGSGPRGRIVQARHRRGGCARAGAVGDDRV